MAALMMKWKRPDVTHLLVIRWWISCCLVFSASIHVVYQESRLYRTFVTLLPVSNCVYCICIFTQVGTLKMRDMKLRDMKMRHHVAGVKNARHENARNAIVWNTACCIYVCPLPSRNAWVDKKEHQISPPTVVAPSAGLRLPWFCVCISLTVMTWTIISWCWLSVTNVFLTFTQVVLSVVLSIVLH